MNITQNAINLLSQTDWHTPAAVPDKAELTDTTTVVRVLYKNDSAVAFYIAPRPQQHDIDSVKLLDQLKKSFSLDELCALTFQLGLDPDALKQTNRDVMALELILYLQRRQQLSDLLPLVRAERPQENWGGVPERYESTPTLTQLNLAVVVSIARPALEDTAVYLHQQQLDANYLLITNTPTYNEEQSLNLPQQTAAVVHTFYTALDRLNRHIQSPAVRKHFFLSCPASLAFALGCAWGTAEEGDIIYHFQQQTYHPIVTISRGLRTQKRS
jgi:hypothetical protein